MELINKIDNLIFEMDKSDGLIDESKSPKFKIGDKVDIKDTNKKGKIVYVDDFDKILNQYIFSVELSNGKIESHAGNELSKK